MMNDERDRIIINLEITCHELSNRVEILLKVQEAFAKKVNILNKRIKRLENKRKS